MHTWSYLLFCNQLTDSQLKFFIKVNDEYLRTLEILSKKLKFVEVDPLVKGSKALKDVQPELEKLRQKAVSKVVN